MVAVNLRNIVLEDKWPGVPNQNLGIPTGGFDATTWTDATTEGYPIGTKIQAYQDFSGRSGLYTMIYLRSYCGTNAYAVEFADNSSTTGMAIFQQWCNSTCLSADGTMAVFTCTNTAVPETGYLCGTKSGVIAIACGTLSARDVTTDGNNIGNYGWFWCDGICPFVDITMYDELATNLGTDMSTAGGVAAGLPIGVEVDTSVLVFDGGEITQNRCGVALATDA